LFPYYPEFILEGLRENQFVSNASREELDMTFYSGTIEKRGKRKPQYVLDTYFAQLLDKAGVDVRTLKTLYNLTPINSWSVYKDFGKYHVRPDFSGVEWHLLDNGARWLAQHKHSCIPRLARALNYDEVVDLIDKTKSATAFYNQFFKTKRELFELEDFRISFVKFCYGYFLGEAYYIPWLAIQKEEVRPWEKIQDLKMRSIIIGSVYTLIVGHMLYADLDAMVAENWLKFRTGIGMSMFDGDYDLFARDLHRKRHYWFSDVGKYDSRQLHYLKQLTVSATNHCYATHKVRFYWLLGSLREVARSLDIPDFEVNMPYVRNRLIEDSTIGPVILPDGEIFWKNTGENSGDHRTGHGNTDRYKIIEFAAASSEFETLREYQEAGYVNHHTGDDNIGGGPDIRLAEKQAAIWRSLGCEVDIHFTDNFYECDYLAARPLIVKTTFGDFYAPSFNTSKVLAGLCCKLETRSIDVDVGRLSSARLMCQFSDDKSVLDEVIRLYLEENPQARGHKAFKTEDEILWLYFGKPQSFFNEFLGLQLGLKGKSRDYQVKKTFMSGLAETAVAMVGSKLLEKAVEKGEQLAQRAIKGSGKRTKARLATQKFAQKKIAKPKKNRRGKMKKIKSGNKRLSNTNELEVPTKFGYTKMSNYFHRKRVVGKSFEQDRMIIKGRALVAEISPVDPLAPYTDLFSMPLNPMALGHGRLTQEAQLWSKFRFKRVRTTVITAIATSSVGDWLISHIPDPEIPISGYGTFTYWQNLLETPGASIVPIWQNLIHDWKPTSEDPKEYYVQPDIQGEDRLVVQGLVKCSCGTVLSALSRNGSIQVEYEVELYGPVLPGTNSSATYSQNAIGTSAPGLTVPQLVDPLAYAAVKMNFNAATVLWSLNTIYACYFNFDFGGLRAFNIYFFQPNTSITTSVNFYQNPNLCKTLSASGQIAGNLTLTDTVPSNGIMYWTPALNTDMPGNKRITEIRNLGKSLADDELTLKSLQLRMDKLTKLLAPRVEEEPKSPLVRFSDENEEEDDSFEDLIADDESIPVAVRQIMRKYARRSGAERL